MVHGQLSDQTRHRLRHNHQVAQFLTYYWTCLCVYICMYMCVYIYIYIYTLAVYPCPLEFWEILFLQPVVA